MGEVLGVLEAKPAALEIVRGLWVETELPVPNVTVRKSLWIVVERRSRRMDPGNQGGDSREYLKKKQSEQGLILRSVLSQECAKL